MSDALYTDYDTTYIHPEKVLTRTKWRYKEVLPLRWRKGMSAAHRRKCLKELGIKDAYCVFRNDVELGSWNDRAPHNTRDAQR
jgi:hypothetical protein